jgi:hypothetical protein
MRATLRRPGLTAEFTERGCGASHSGKRQMGSDLGDNCLRERNASIHFCKSQIACV